MKTLKYIALSLLVAASTTACKDDPELLTTDVGPEMTVVSADASGVYGGKVDFEVTMTDRYALSTLKAQVFFDDEMVAEEVIRTKSDGTYTGAVTLPFYKNIPDGEATLRFVGQNVRFGTTTVDRPLAVSRPKPAYLTFFLDDAEYRMEPTGNDYEYAVTDEFPQKPQGYIATPELNADGSGLATLSDDGHGAVYFIGYGIGSPAAVNEPGWTTEKGVCVPESAPGIYTMTAQAGLEGSTTLGQRFRVSGWSGKFFRTRGWDGLGAFTLAPGAEAFFSIAGNGNIEIASGVTLEEGATYRLTLDVTAGKDNPVLSLVKK